jgi:hypothetical protein
MLAVREDRNGDVDQAGMAPVHLGAPRLPHPLFGRPVRYSARLGLVPAEVIDKATEQGLGLDGRAGGVKQGGAGTIERICGAHEPAKPHASRRTILGPNEVDLPYQSALVNQQEEELDELQILLELPDEELPLPRGDESRTGSACQSPTSAQTLSRQLWWGKDPNAWTQTLVRASSAKSEISCEPVI